LHRLQAENVRLSQEQREKTSSTDDVHVEASSFEDGMIQKLKEQVDRQRNELKHANNELQEKNESIEQFTAEIDQIKHQNTETKKRSKSLQNQVKALCEERADFLAKIQDQHRDMVSMKKQLGIVEKENEDLEREDSTTPRFTVAELKEVLAERNDLKNRINDLEEELMACRPTPTPSSSQGEKTIQKETEEEAPVQGKADARVGMLQRCSLALVPPQVPCLRNGTRWTIRGRGKTPRLASVNCEFHFVKHSSPSINSNAQHIRLLLSSLSFRKLFAENESGPSFPKRSLSTLTKMALSASGASGPHTDIPI
jgi:RILP-like protein 1